MSERAHGSAERTQRACVNQIEPIKRHETAWKMKTNVRPLVRLLVNNAVGNRDPIDSEERSVGDDIGDVAPEHNVGDKLFIVVEEELLHLHLDRRLEGLERKEEGEREENRESALALQREQCNRGQRNGNRLVGEHQDPTLYRAVLVAAPDARAVLLEKHFAAVDVSAARPVAEPPLLHFVLFSHLHVGLRGVARNVFDKRQPFLLVRIFDFEAPRCGVARTGLGSTNALQSDALALRAPLSPLVLLLALAPRRVLPGLRCGVRLLFPGEHAIHSVLLPLPLADDHLADEDREGNAEHESSGERWKFLRSEVPACVVCVGAGRGVAVCNGGGEGGTKRGQR